VSTDDEKIFRIRRAMWRKEALERLGAQACVRCFTFTNVKATPVDRTVDGSWPEWKPLCEECATAEDLEFRKRVDAQRLR